MIAYIPSLVIPSATKLAVRFSGSPVPHLTSGYRDWAGTFESTEAIVALVCLTADDRTNWVRTSHRGTPSLPTGILFAPYDDQGRNIQVCFSILDATAYGRAIVKSIQVHPSPTLQSFATGELVTIANIESEPRCTLSALFLARRDVVSVRNGIWHARGNMTATLPLPWRKLLTWGRTGELSCDELAKVE